MVSVDSSVILSNSQLNSRYLALNALMLKLEEKCKQVKTKRKLEDQLSLDLVNECIDSLEFKEFLQAIKVKHKELSWLDKLLGKPNSSKVPISHQVQLVSNKIRLFMSSVPNCIPVLQTFYECCVPHYVVSEYGGEVHIVYIDKDEGVRRCTTSDYRLSDIKRQVKWLEYLTSLGVEVQVNTDRLQEVDKIINEY